MTSPGRPDAPWVAVLLAAAVLVSACRCLDALTGGQPTPPPRVVSDVRDGPFRVVLRVEDEGSTAERHELAVFVDGVEVLPPFEALPGHQARFYDCERPPPGPGRAIVCEYQDYDSAIRVLLLRAGDGGVEALDADDAGDAAARLHWLPDGGAALRPRRP